MNIGEILSKAIKEGKWLDISYHNSKEEETAYWIGIKDIDPEKKTLRVAMYNHSKSSDTTKLGTIRFDGIKYANIIDFSSFDTPTKLIEKIENNLSKCAWLNYDKFNHNVLNYYQECNYLDTDPQQKEYAFVKGIDLESFRKNKKITLSEEQINQIIKDIYKYDIRKKNNSYNVFAINVLSIDVGNKKYVVAYYQLGFNPERKELVIDKMLRFNNQFLIDGRTHSLFNYINGDVDEFTKHYAEDPIYYNELLSSHFRYGEIINTRPEMMILERENIVDLTTIYERITQKYYDNKLTPPLKAFFGNISKNDMRRKKEPSLIIYDNRININQMRVLYNAIKYPVTYVQGPPGTGKTQTIVNVVLSAFYNDKKMLICSSNNKPVNGIIELLKFKYKNDNINFPYLRLGNVEEVKKATLKIKELFEFSTNKVPKDALLDKIKGSNDDNNAKLLELLKTQEKRLEIEDYLENSKKLIESFKNSDSKVIGVIKNKIAQLKEDLLIIPEVSNDELIGLFEPLKDNYQLSQYLYFKSLQYTQKLKSKKYKELIDICSIKDDDERVSQFNKWTIKDENMNLLSDVFPVIFTTNISSQRLGGADFLFDLVIMDESGQCNAAQALIPISKASTVLLIGDPNQLKPVVILDASKNDELMEKYHIPKTYNYKNNSILDVMIQNDNLSKYILLKYHYRCGKNIINFSNQRYYRNALNLDYIADNGNLEVLDVKNNNVLNKNEAIDEANAIIDYIKRNDVKDAFIITPFVAQKDLLNSLLEKNNIADIECGTIHSIQGAEKGTIIFSLAISQKTSAKTFEWLKSNYELINVAVTRAKKKLVIAGDTEIVKCRSDKKDDLYNLIEYAKNNGKITVPQNESVKIEIGKSNGSKAESEFFDTISHFCSCNKTFQAERNIKVNTLFKDEKSMVNYEFDMVLYEKKNFNTKPVIVFEVNGAEHLGVLEREQSDMKKKDVCMRHGVKIVFIPNSLVKAYGYIADVIYHSQGGDKYSQTSLFDMIEV